MLEKLLTKMNYFLNVKLMKRIKVDFSLLNYLWSIMVKTEQGKQKEDFINGTVNSFN